MNPELREGTYVFATVTENQLQNINPIMVFQEKEGKTAIITTEQALSQHIPYETTWSFITLSVHSNLQAIGFLAAITKKLAEARISVNAISAFYHDHLFVPTKRAEDAMHILQKFSSDL